MAGDVSLSPSRTIQVRTSRKSQMLESEAGLKRFLRRKSWFTMEWQRQQANRFQMAIDEAYYDNEQWTPEESADVLSRGQNPVVNNEIAPTVDFLKGTELRMRTDFEVFNRTDDSAEATEDAQTKTKLLKYLDDVNRAPFERSQAVDDQLKAGLGWLEVVAIGDPTMQPVRMRSESWRCMLHDSLGRSRTTEDWRYVFRFKEVDLDIAEAMLPGKGDQLRKAVITHDTRQYFDWFGTGGGALTGLMPAMDNGLPRKWNTYDADAWINNPRERVLLIECWATEPFGGPAGADRGNVEASSEGAIRMRKRVAIMTEYDTLIESWSPYRHGRYPFIPLWCYRRKKDGQPYGIPRRPRGPQDNLNKLMSKAYFRLSVNQVRLEHGALNEEVMDKEELREEAAAPDGILEFASGALSGKKVEFREGIPMAEAELRLAEHNKASIRQSSGVSGEDRGLDHNDVSGKARSIRRDQGSLLTAEIFDNILLARQVEGELTLSMVEQYNTEEMVFSVPGEVKRHDHVRINTMQADGTRLNDITKRSAQFIIGEKPWAQALSEAAFDSMMDMLGSVAKVAPQVVVNLLDVVFEMNPNLPKKGRVLQRIRQATGMSDPDKGPTPEQQAEQGKKQQMADAQFQAALAELQAKVAKTQKEGGKIDADAFAKQLEGLYMAAQAAQLIAMAPALAPIVDELSKSAGFIDKDGPPLIAAPTSPVDTGPPIAPPQGANGPLVGHLTGIHTPQPDGIRPQPGVPQ